MKLSKNFLPVALIVGGIATGFFTFSHHQQQKTHHPLTTSSEPSKNKASQTSQAVKNQIVIEPKVINYQCDNQKIVQASYDQAPAIAVSKTVKLMFDGQQYEFGFTPSPIGSLYASTQVTDLGQSLRWHVQGLEARLLTTVADPVTHVEKEELLLRCQQPIG